MFLVQFLFVSSLSEHITHHHDDTLSSNRFVLSRGPRLKCILITLVCRLRKAFLISLLCIAGAENQQSTQQKRIDRRSNEAEEVPVSNQLRDVISNAENLTPEWIDYLQQNGHNVEKNTAFLGYNTNPEKILFTVYRLVVFAGA